MNAKDLEEALEMGMDWSLREGYVWAEDKVELDNGCSSLPPLYVCNGVYC